MAAHAEKDRHAAAWDWRPHAPHVARQGARREFVERTKMRARPACHRLASHPPTMARGTLLIDCRSPRYT